MSSGGIMHSIGKPFVKFYKKHKRSRGNQKEITPVLNLKDDLKEKLCKKISLGKLYTIWSWLPPRYAVCQPELLYTSEEHGTSLMTLYSRVENHQPTLLFIKTTDDEVFGAFCSTYWRERRHSTKNVSYFGTGETFLFTLVPEKRKYEWVGLTQEDVPNTANMFMAGDSSILTVGGGNGEAIQLDANLLHCRTERCDTFANDPLCVNEDFTCKVVEVYGFH